MEISFHTRTKTALLRTWYPSHKGQDDVQAEVETTSFLYENRDGGKYNCEDEKQYVCEIVARHRLLRERAVAEA